MAVDICESLDHFRAKIIDLLGEALAERVKVFAERVDAVKHRLNRRLRERNLFC